jgi:hypothetical protein
MKFPHSFNPEVFENNVENMRFFIENYKPKMEDISPLMVDTDEVEKISKLNPQLVWTEIQTDSTCITNGFLDAEKDDRINGYYICDVICEDKPLTNSIYTEVRVNCEKCDIDDETDEVCEMCFGDGFSYRYLNEIWPGL